MIPKFCSLVNPRATLTPTLQKMKQSLFLEHNINENYLICASLYIVEYFFFLDDEVLETSVDSASETADSESIINF